MRKAIVFSDGQSSSPVPQTLPPVLCHHPQYMHTSHNKEVVLFLLPAATGWRKECLQLLQISPAGSFLEPTSQRERGNTAAKIHHTQLCCICQDRNFQLDKQCTEETMPLKEHTNHTLATTEQEEKRFGLPIVQ